MTREEYEALAASLADDIKTLKRQTETFAEQLSRASRPQRIYAPFLPFNSKFSNIPGDITYLEPAEPVNHEKVLKTVARRVWLAMKNPAGVDPLTVELLEEVLSALASIGVEP